MAILYEYNGVRGLEKIAFENGIAPGTLKNRIYHYGLTIEQAVEAGPGSFTQRKPRSRYEYQGVEGLPAIAELTGISVGTLSRRVYNEEMTIEDAVAKGVRRLNRKTLTQREKRVAARIARERVVPIYYPDLLSEYWKLALGMRTSL